MAMKDNQQIQDPSTQGTEGLKGLEGINRLREKGINIDTTILNLAQDYRGTMRAINQSTAPKQNIGFVGVNDSRYDKEITSASQLDNLANTRGELQPWYAQIGAGLTKGAILASTTFLDGTLGLVLGGVQAIAEGRVSALWDNPFSKAMQSVNEAYEEILPNYYTDAERNEPWYENVFTANFLGDKFIKNLGFSIGAIYSGGVTAAGLKATKLPQIIGAVAKSSKAPKMVTSGVGSVISAVNEGRIEALNNSTDWFNLQKAQLDDKHNARLQAIEQYAGTEMYNQLVMQENANYEATLGKLTEDRLKMGNVDLLMNIPILTASNVIQFGKLYANGFKTARKATNIVGRVGEYSTGRTIGKGITRTLLNPLSEGIEELAQKTAATVSGLAYEQDVNNFYKSKIDPEAEQQTIDWIKAFAQGINGTVNDGSSWEEFFIGTLTGALGIPMFRGIRNSEGKLQSPITLEGGIVGGLREYRDKMKGENNIVNYLNARVQSPEFRNYYQGLIRHNKYQNDMNRAVEANDEFEFKNAEHAQLVSDIAMFDNAGKLEDLTTLINSAYDTSDENLASIVENTTSTVTDKNGKESKVGPFIDKNGNPMYSTPEGKQEMINKLTQTKDEMLSTITNYTKIKDDIDVRTGQQLSDEQLEELTWLKSQIGNWQERAGQLSSEVKPTIGTILGSMSQLADMYNSIKNEEGKAHTGLSDLYKNADKSERQLRKNMSILETVRGLDDKTFAHLLSSDPKLVNRIKSVIGGPLSGVDADDIQTINNKIDDIVKLVNATSKYNAKLKEYLENPDKLQKDIVSSTESIAKEEAKKKSDNLKSKLLSVTNLSEFRKALNEEENAATREETLKSLEEENNEMAKNYREVNSYNNDVQRAINSLDESPEVKADALRLLQDQFENSSNLSEIANPNSIYIDNADTLYDDSLSPEENTKKFQEAQYALLRAMNQINNENRFKDRFSKEYRELRVKGKPNPFAPEKDTTGDSGTATIPSVNTEGLPNTTYESPVGNITTTQVSDENKQLNKEAETFESFDTKQKGRRLYYRPSIPELHIQASKEGDFRPFNTVVAEREKGVNFDVLYNYLRDNGAFTYVNEGNLKVGDELGFMIDPALEEQMKSYEWYKGPTILLIDKRNNQVVGSLDESQYSVDRYEGLSSLEEKIKDEFAKSNEKDKRFIASPTTRVSQIMVGRIPYGTEERSLANIPNVSGEGKVPIFGIIKNGVLNTNKDADIKINYDDIIKPANMEDKEGRMYLLIPNAAGKYSPAAVRVKHFNKTEFNPEDVEVQNTQVYKNIQESIDALADSLNEDDLNNAVKSLATNLYTGDLHIDWFTSDVGNGIRFTKVQRDAQGKEIYEEKDGKKIRREEVYTVFISNKISSDPYYIGSIGVEEDDLLETKDVDTIKKEITNTLLKMNLPIQVNLGMLNRGGYNNILVSSNVLTSNISDARVLSSWFTTDYFDNEGNLHQAVSLASVIPQPIRRIETPVGGKEGVIMGTGVIVDGTTYGVDLSTGAIYNSNNQRVTPTNAQLIKDLAWASANFGDAVNGSFIWNNKVLLPSGQVLDRRTQKYLTGKEAQEVKDRIAGRVKTVTDSKKIIAQIDENQKRVDKTRTDGKFYYILEDDGQYHEYERVHTRLGNNWIESEEQTTNIRSINSQRALKAGTTVDSIVRDFFISNNTPIKPDNMSEKAFIDLITSLTEIRSSIEARGERFLTNNIVLFQKYPDGTRVAGEVDILSVDTDGNFRIYDVKTKKYSFYDFVDNHGNKVNYFINPLPNQRMSDKDYYTLQLSAYKNLFESQYHTPITNLAILPFVLNYNNKDIIESITKEKGIKITYNPAVNVPLIGTVNISTPTSTNSAVPVFNSALEIQNPINDVLPEYSLENSKVGYFVRDGKLHKGYLTPIGQVNGIEVYMTKVPSITKGFGRPGEEAHVAYNSYMAVFPNGNSFTLVKNDLFGTPKAMTEQQAKGTIKKMLEGNPQRVVDMSNEKTLIFDPDAVPTVGATPTSNTTDTKKTKVERIPSISKERISLIRNELTSILNKFYPKEIEGNDFYIEEALKGKRPYFLTDKYGKALTIDTIISDIKSSLAELEKTKIRREEIAEKTKGQLSQIDDLRGVEATISVYRKRIAKDLANAFYILYESENPSEDSVVGDTTVETPATILSNTADSGASLSAKKMQSVNEHDDEFEDDLDLGSLRRIDSERNVWNQEKELAWIKKVLPQLSDNDRIRVVKGLIRVADSGTYAWGQFNKGIITLSDIAAEGTAYHEAFHVVFSLLLDNSERVSLLNEYRKKHPNMDDLNLEEELAEDFREFVMQGGKDTRSLGRKIIDFFKSLFIKTKYWKDFRPSSIYYFRAINEGKYSEENIPITTSEGTRYKQEEYTQEMKDILAKAPRDSQGRLLAPNGKVSNLTEKQYAQVRTKAFKEWFGDWENNPANASKVVDENGEPLVVYHGTTKDFTTFSKDKLGSFTHAASAKLAFFATSNENLAKDIYAKLEDNEHFYERLLATDPNFTREDLGIVPEDNPEDRIYSEFINNYDNLNYEYKDVIEEANKLITYKSSTKEITISEALEWVEDKDISDYEKEGFIISDKQLSDYKEGKEITISKPIKVSDGSTLEERIAKLNTSRSKEYLKNLKELENIRDKELLELKEELKHVYNSKVKALFLNIRNPKIDSDNGHKYRAESYLKRIQKAINNNNDGGIIKDTQDPYLANIYYFFEPNQTKSATDNIGTFDSNNPDTRYRKVPSIEELRAQEKSVYERFNNNTKEHYFYFDSLDSEIQMMLLNKGWTKEQFNSISQQERDQAVKCIAL